MAERVLLLASGGLDSTTLAYQLGDEGLEVVPLFIDYGQHCAITEVSTLRAVLPADVRARLACVDVSDVYANTASRLISEANLWEDNVTHEDLYLPYRNLLLITVGSAYARARQIAVVYAAFINSNHALEVDCSGRFFAELHKLLSVYGGVEVKMPLREMTKTDVARRAVALGVPLAATFSCQTQSVVPCGACPNCVDRLAALAAIGIEH
jgi:7-cyano-7-deazaguanine synthase